MTDAGAGSSTRTAPGRPFQKGKSGNPSGRPKVAGLVRDIARKHTKEAIDTLVSLMREAEKESVRAYAAEALLDRACGKPSQSVEHSGPDGGAVVFDFSVDLSRARE